MGLTFAAFRSCSVTRALERRKSTRISAQPDCVPLTKKHIREQGNGLLQAAVVIGQLQTDALAFDEPLLHSPHGCLSAIARIDFAENVLHVFLHGFDADRQRASYFSITQT